MDDISTQKIFMRLLLSLLIITFSIQACGPQTRKASTPPIDPEAQAKQMLATGHPLQAAENYMQLIRLYPNKTVSYQLKAADAYITAAKLDTAMIILGNTNIQDKNQPEAFFKTILLARLALARDSAEQALTLLNNIPPLQAADSMHAAYHETSAQAYELLHSYINAIQARINLGAFLQDPDENIKNNTLIWSDLGQINLPVLKQLHPTTSGELGSWMELAIINQSMLFEPKLLAPAITSWIQQYPGHPAVPSITNSILGLSKHYEVLPEHIALCLPMTGQYERASRAIRDGFLAAWFATSEYKPRISLYDANTLNILDIYHKAIENGADFIVGPLEKQAIAKLLASGDLPVTILALNQYNTKQTELTRDSDISTIPAIIQFGLSPEDEVRQIAERATHDGHVNALVIIPNNDWGLRLYDTFRERWESLGGRVLKQVNYAPKTKDYSTPVKALLNINSSAHRSNLLRQKLNRSLKSEQRLRQDADMIFMAAIPVAARQIVPQFKFFRADKIQIYSSSHIYTGKHEPSLDSDMNDVLFTDIPWVLDLDREVSLIQQSINRNWDAENSGLRRLYALGIDAYHLIPNVGRLTLQKSATYPGETGELYLTESGRIQRKLLWAKFIDGKPQMLEQEEIN